MSLEGEENEKIKEKRTGGEWKENFFVPPCPNQPVEEMLLSFLFLSFP